MKWLREWVYRPLFKTPLRTIFFAILCSVAYRFLGLDMALWMESTLVGMLTFSFGATVASMGLAIHYKERLETFSVQVNQLIRDLSEISERQS